MSPMTVSVIAAIAAEGSRLRSAMTRPGAHGARASGAGAASVNATSEPGVTLGMPLPGIGGRVSEVGEDGANDDKRAGQEHDGQHEWIVPVADGLYRQ